MCSFFLRGKCKNTHNCKFKHERPAEDKSNVPVCPYWARRECRYGENCLFKHLTDDVEVLTERYNAQLLAEASHGLQYVYDPTTGTTYPVQASSEYSPSQQYFQPGATAMGMAYSAVPAHINAPVYNQASVFTNGQYPQQSTMQRANAFLPTQYQPQGNTSSDSSQYQLNSRSQGALQYTQAATVPVTLPQGSHLSTGTTNAPKQALPAGMTVQNVIGTSQQTNEDRSKNNNTKKRVREITTLEEQPEKRIRHEW